MAHAAACDEQAGLEKKQQQELKEKQERERQEKRELEELEREKKLAAKRARGPQSLDQVIDLDPPKPKLTRKEAKNAKDAFLQFHR